MNTLVLRWTGIASALALTLGLAGCGEYSPVGTGGAETSTDAQGEQSGGAPTPEETTPEPSPQGGGGAEGGSAEGGGAEGGGNSGGDSGGGNSGGDSGGGESGGGESGGEIPVVYTWSLPPSDISPSDNDGTAYSSLLHGSCDEADPRLDPAPPYGHKPFGLSNPRVVLLLTAGAAMCRGDDATARSFVASALDQWGTAGLDRPWFPKRPEGGGEEARVTDRPPGYGETECDLYRTLTSVLEQVAPDQLECPGGSVPQFGTKDYLHPAGYSVTAYDNPLTPGDESEVPPPQAVDEARQGGGGGGERVPETPETPDATRGDQDAATIDEPPTE